MVDTYGLGQYGQGDYGRYDPSPVAPGVQTPRPPADVRVRAYDPNGDTVGTLPTPTDISAQFALSDVGALTLTYPLGAPRAALLGRPLELAVEVTWDGGQTWNEPPGGRFQYLRDEGDGTKPWEGYKITAPGYVKRLEKALVGSAGLNDEGRRDYVQVTAGAILADLWDLAQARGVLVGMTRTWTATADSNGAPWPELQSIAYEPGVNLLAVLQGMADQGWVDYRTTGRSVQVYVADSPTGMGQDQTLGATPVTLRYGRDLTEAPFRRTWEGLSDTVLVQGEERTFLTRTNPSAITPWGRQETFVTASGVSDTGTLTVIGDAALTFTERERVEHTLGLEFAATPHLPFRDYLPGNWVYASTDSNAAPTRMRVRGITVGRDESGAMNGNVTLNDKFLEGDILQARRLQRITGGATQAGSGGIPSGIGNDILQPAQVTGLATSSDAYVDPDGQVRAQITVQWADTTTNADGTPASDIAHYEVWARVPAKNPQWAQVATTTASEWFNSPYEPGVTWEFKVRAVDTVYNLGAFSAAVSVATPFDATPPPKPSTPTGTSRLGTARITWNGLTATGTNMAATVPDFRYVDVHIDLVPNFTPTTANRVGELNGPGYVIAGPLAYNSVYLARLVAYDSSGNASAVSDELTITVAPLVDVSNFPDTAMETLYARTGHFIDVTADMIQANAIKTLHLETGAITAEKIGVGAVVADKIGTGLLQANVKIVAGALLNSGARVEMRADGLFAYNASGAQTFGLTASSGAAVFSGSITGSTVDGGTVTGSVVQTSAPGAGYYRVAMGAQGYGDSVVDWWHANGVHMTRIGPWGTGYGSQLSSINGGLLLYGAGGIELDPGPQWVTSWRISLGTSLNTVIAPGITNTGSGGGSAVHINRSNNIMYYFTSGLKHKLDVKKLDLAGRSVWNVDPITYLDKMHKEAHDKGDPMWSFPPEPLIGFTAESFVREGFTELVGFDDEGVPDNLDYARVTVLLLAASKARFEALEKEIVVLKNKVALK